jgi:cell division septation protein DedD
MRLTNYLLIFLTAFLFACASSQETTHQTQKKEPEVLVFDDVNKNDTTKVEISKQVDPTKQAEPKPEVISPQQITSAAPMAVKYIVQVGVFTSQERAQSFVNENQSKIVYLMNITLRDTDKRFVVRLKPFATREEAEMVRNNIWQIPAFKDAFIITIE